jgi:hypothetical protein
MGVRYKAAIGRQTEDESRIRGYKSGDALQGQADFPVDLVRFEVDEQGGELEQQGLEIEAVVQVFLDDLALGDLFFQPIIPGENGGQNEERPRDRPL